MPAHQPPRYARVRPRPGPESRLMPFPPGSIVKRRLSGFAGLFFHHMGVYVGNDTVVHFGGETKFANALLLRESLTAFAAGKGVVLHAAPKNPAHGQAVCAEAERQYADSRN